jgi:hypothetical protein
VTGLHYYGLLEQMDDKPSMIAISNDEFVSKLPRLDIDFQAEGIVTNAVRATTLGVCPY